MLIKITIKKEANITRPEKLKSDSDFMLSKKSQTSKLMWHDGFSFKLNFLVYN